MSQSNEGMGYEPGVPGASARREYERRRQSRELRVQARYPQLGGLLLALQKQPAHERAWATGATGEEQVAQQLAKYLDTGTVLLHDRRVRGTRSNIDHIAIAPSGVWVIDSKRYKGNVSIRRPLFGKPRLIINGRDKTTPIEGVHHQVELVEAALRGLPRVPVHGALCFVDADLPLLRRLNLNGYPLLYPRQLAKRINAPGPVTAEAVQTLSIELTRSFRAS